MENTELLRYIKDAIDLETSIVEQEQLIEQVTATQHRHKPQLVLKAAAKTRPQLKHEDYVNPTFRWSIGIGITSLVIGFCVFLFTNHYANLYAEYGSILREETEAMIHARSVSLFICLFGLFCFIPAVYSAKSAQRQQTSNLATYNSELQSYDRYIAVLNEENNQLRVQHRKETDAWSTSYQLLTNRIAEPLATSRALLDKLYAQDIIYPKYRTLPALTSIYEYFMTGRCTELTGPNGAYNLYESEVRADTIISQLNTVIENLEKIRQNQYMLYQQVSAIQANTARIASELRQIKGYTVQITELTALNAYYAALNERNTRITMYYHL